MVVIDALRDALILYFFTFVAGAIFAFLGGSSLPGYDYVLYALEAVLIFAGFFVVGWHTEDRRYWAAAMRGFFLWFLCAMNFSIGIDFSGWLLNGVSIAGLLLAAEGFLLVLRRKKKALFVHFDYRKIRSVLGDSLAVCFTTVVAGIVAGISGLESPENVLVFVSPALLFFGFLISGFFVRERRFIYMASVATIVWFLGGVYMFSAAGFSAWIFGGLITYGMMLASWAVLRGFKFCCRAGA